jgi:phosphoribosylformylglycinamidine synthase subunit PurQ / glutaminase
MATPRAVVLRTAGTNCDVETRFALKLAGAQAELMHVNRLAAEEDPLGGFQLLVLPGGFTYGDDVAAGKVMAIELQHVLGQKLVRFAESGGLVIGICNGFQVLVKMGLLPGATFVGPGARKVTLTVNDSHRFEARWVRLRAAENTHCVFVAPGEELELPVAHGEGKLVTRAPEVLSDLISAGQVAYRYASRQGRTPAYPEDPNGSVDHIAGLCDPSGRVFGLMPHPERHIFGYHHPRWTREGLRREGEGLQIFKRAVEYCRGA